MVSIEKSRLVDVIVVGAGPAGLSAALVLGRCRRRVILFDHGETRNAASDALHAFLTRDGISPREFLRTAHAQLEPYETVQVEKREVIDIRRTELGFEILTRDGRTCRSRKVLLATGLTDELPPLKNIEDFYGKSVHHCPYCDGWEWRDGALAVYGRGQRGFRLALTLLNWSRDVVLLSDGPSRLKPENRESLAKYGISLQEAPIDRLEGRGGKLKHVIFKTGEVLERDAIFFNRPSHQSSGLVQKLGCRLGPKGGVLTSQHEIPDMPGLYAAGNILRDVQLVIVAAAEGARAAFKINAALHAEDLELERIGDFDAPSD